MKQLNGLKEKQNKVKQLTKDLERSLKIQQIDKDAFLKSSFKLRAISADPVYLRKSKIKHVLLNNGVCILRVEKIYNDGTKENYPLNLYAQLKGGKLK